MSKFIRINSPCKRTFLESTKLAYANKTRESYTTTKICSSGFSGILSNKSKSTIFLLLMFFMFSLSSRTNLKLRNIIGTPMIHKKKIAINSSKMSGPVRVPLLLLHCYFVFHCYFHCYFEHQFSFTDDYLSMCLKEFCCPDCWEVSLLALCIKMLGIDVRL